MKDLLRPTICCSQAGYTLCFPDTQIIPNGTTQSNPFYDFVDQQSFWTYTIQLSESANSFQQFAVQICSELAARTDKNDFKVERSDDNGVTFTNINGFQVSTHDNLTGLDNVIRINESGNPGTFTIFRITILNPNFFNLAPEAGSLVIRNQNTNFLFDSTTCNPALPTPSVNCTRIPPPSRGITFCPL